jgi:hypothetical protein
LAFRQNLQELADVLKDYTTDGSRVLFVFHPHIQHLKPDAAGHLWNDLVSSSVQKMSAANNFLFFNATRTLKQRFGSHPENFYWRSGDMHYDFKGLEEYFTAVAAVMASAMINPKRVTASSLIAAPARLFLYVGAELLMSTTDAGRRRAVEGGSRRRGPVILINPYGRPWALDGFRTSSGSKACARAGISGLTFHDLRSFDD